LTSKGKLLPVYLRSEAKLVGEKREEQRGVSGWKDRSAKKKKDNR